MLRTLAIACILLLISLPPAGAARTYTVDDDQYAYYHTIGAAVAAASPGDTIYVYPGEYNEEVILDKSLTISPLIGEKGQILLGGVEQDVGIKVSADGCTIMGLTIQGFLSAGIEVDSQGNSIADNILIDDRAGILLKGGSKNLLENNDIRACQGGVVLWEDQGQNTIIGNTFQNCNFSIMANVAGNDLLKDNVIIGGDRGIYLLNSSAIRAEGNSIKDCFWGVTVEKSTGATVHQTNVTNASSALNLLECAASAFYDNVILSTLDTGITLSNSQDNVFNDNQVKDAAFGMVADFAINNTLKGNRFQGCDVTLTLYQSQGNTLKNNTINETNRGLYVEDITGEKGYQNLIDESNSINGLPVLYIYLASDQVIKGKDVSHLTLAYSRNVTVEDCVIASDALMVAGGQEILLLNNSILGNWGIALLNVTKSVIRSNTAWDNRFSGLVLMISHGNLIQGNNLSRNNQYGLGVVASDGNVVTENLLAKNNDSGIWLNQSNHNRITLNEISGNGRGIFLGDTSGDLIYHNNFVDNQLQAEDRGNNTWDMGPEEGGNYWSDHNCKGNPCGNFSKLLKGAAIDHFPFSQRDGWLLINLSEGDGKTASI